MYILPNHVRNIINTLESNCHEAYIVGGSVRDLLLNKTPNDYDVTTSCLPQGISALFEKTIENAKKLAFFHFDPSYNDEKLTTTVEIGTNVKTILPWMFSCVRMKKIEIPNSVTYIGEGAFSYCYILTEVSCKNTTPPTLGKNVFYNDRDENNNNLLIKVPYTPTVFEKYRSKWSQYYNRMQAYYTD